MATNIKLKNSVTTTAAPSTLVQGEAAVNITDKKLWVGNASSTPIQIAGPGGDDLAVADGGTGASTAADARTNLGAQATLVSGTNIKTVNGSSLLGSGDLTTPSSVNMKNRIINGAMVIDQRNAGASVTASTTDTYTLDRFCTFASQASKYSVQQNAGSVTPPTGFTNYLGVTSLSAYSITSGDYFGVYQRVEGFNIADLNWGTASAKTVTISFQVYSSLTGTFGASLRNSAADRSYPFTYTVSSANTWTTISVTIAGDTSGTWLTTNGTGIMLSFGLGVGSTYSNTAGSWYAGNYSSATGATSVVGTSGATFYITGVQLEVGSSATGFEYRQYGTELALCQRYYQKFGGNSTYETFTVVQAYSGTAGWGCYPLKVNMRANPTFAPTSGANLQLMNSSGTGLACSGGVDIGYGSNTTPDLFPNVASGLTAGNASVFRSAGTTSGYISFSAEL